MGTFRISLACVRINFRFYLRALELVSFCFIVSRGKGMEMVAISVLPFVPVNLCSPGVETTAFLFLIFFSQFTLSFNI